MSRCVDAVALVSQGFVHKSVHTFAAPKPRDHLFPRELKGVTCCLSTSHRCCSGAFRRLSRSTTSGLSGHVLGHCWDTGPQRNSMGAVRGSRRSRPCADLHYLGYSGRVAVCQRICGGSGPARSRNAISHPAAPKAQTVAWVLLVPGMPSVPTCDRWCVKGPEKKNTRSTVFIASRSGPVCVSA